METTAAIVLVLSQAIGMVIMWGMVFYVIPREGLLGTTTIVLTTLAILYTGTVGSIIYVIMKI